MEFRRFVEEREAIRNGADTCDEILAAYHFTNINRNDDFGTKLLVDNATSQTDAIGYRWFGSRRDHFSNPPTKALCLAYTTPRCKPGQQVTPMIQGIVSGLSDYSPRSGSIIEATMDLIEATKLHSNNSFNYVFHSSEICKDFSLLGDDVDEDSECLVGIGAVAGLKCIERGYGYADRTNSIKGIKLVDKHSELAEQVRKQMFGDWTFQNIEHALCEYSKYHRIKLTGSGRKRRLN